MSRAPRRRATRADLIERYAKARRRHDRQRATGVALAQTTAELLRVEIRDRQARRQAARPVALADLFGLGETDRDGRPACRA